MKKKIIMLALCIVQNAMGGDFLRENRVIIAAVVAAATGIYIYNNAASASKIEPLFTDQNKIGNAPSAPDNKMAVLRRRTDQNGMGAKRRLLAEEINAKKDLFEFVVRKSYKHPKESLTAVLHPNRESFYIKKDSTNLVWAKFPRQIRDNEKEIIIRLCNDIIKNTNRYEVKTFFCLDVYSYIND